jgi:hypothetical protein
MPRPGHLHRAPTELTQRSRDSAACSRQSAACPKRTRRVVPWAQQLVKRRNSALPTAALRITAPCAAAGASQLRPARRCGGAESPSRSAEAKAGRSWARSGKTGMCPMPGMCLNGTADPRCKRVLLRQRHGILGLSAAVPDFTVESCLHAARPAVPTPLSSRWWRTAHWSDTCWLD